MIGRNRERKRLLEMLSAARGFVQIVGPPGMGKSTLALDVVPDGVWVSLDHVQEGGVPEALAAALDVPADPGALIAAFAESELVVFDGAESHALALTELLGDLREGANTLVLVTTQVRLPGASVLELGPLEEADAVALFSARAQAVSAGVDLAEEEESVRELVRRLDRWPLAVALAASRVRLFSAAEMLNEPTLEVLADPQKRGRHASLAQALEGSWGLLSVADRAALSRIALARGTFTRERFKSTTGASLLTLEVLLDASLILWVADPLGRRYRLLEPIRAFALARLAADDPARERFVSEVLDRAALLGPRVTRSNGREALESLRAMVPDLEGLLPLGGEVAARAILALEPLVNAIGPVPPFLARIEKLDLSAVPEEPREALKLLRISLLTRTGGEVQAHKLCEDLREGPARDVRLGETLMRLGRLTDALKVLEAATEEARKSGDLVLAHRGLLAHAATMFSRGDYVACAARCHEGLKLVEGMDRPDIEGLLLRCLAGAERVASDRGLEGARYRLERAVDLFRSVHHQRYEVRTLTGLAIVEAELGLATATERAKVTVPFAYRIGEVFSAQRLQLIQGLIALEDGDLHRLDELMDAIRSPRPPIVAAGMLYRGLAAWLRGERERGMVLLEDGVALFRRLEMAFDCALANHFLAIAREDPAPEIPGDALPILKRANQIAKLQHEGRAIPASLRSDCVWSLDLRLLLRMTSVGLLAVVGADGAWFSTSVGKVELGRRRVLRRVLKACAESVGVPLSTASILKKAWPDEVTLGQSGRARVHVAVSELRKLGLRDALKSVPMEGGGYILHARLR